MHSKISTIKSRKQDKSCRTKTDDMTSLKLVKYQEDQSKIIQL